MKYLSVLIILLGYNITNGYSSEEISEFKSFFSENHKIIGCINTKTNETKEPTESGNCYYGKGYQNILLPPITHLNIYLEVYDNNVRRIINSFPTENVESGFNPDAQNSHAIGYVQTLRIYNIGTSIKEQLEWKINRQDSQKTGICKENKGNEYNMLECLYRSHYHFYEGHAYAKKSLKIRQYYLNYFGNKF